MTGRDMVFFAVFALVTVLAATGAWAVRARIAGFLTPREWQLLGKIVAILAFLFLVMLTQIVRELPASLFLYGRF
jgi:hypothetical protein